MGQPEQANGITETTVQPGTSAGMEEMDAARRGQIAATIGAMALALVYGDEATGYIVPDDGRECMF